MKTLVLLFCVGLSLADNNLPVLYRVDQPTSNVVVFRGADVAKARAAGLIKSPAPAPASSYRPAPTPAASYRPAPTAAPVTYAPPTTTPAPTYAPPTTTAPPPPPPRTYAPRVVYRPAPTYRPAPAPAPKVVYRPAPAPAPVTYRPAPVVSYKPAPSAPAPSYRQPAYPDVPANYNWEYLVKDDYSNNDFGAKESRDGYNTQGEYYVALPDGRLQTVTYVADENGYQPNVVYTGEAQYPPEQKSTYAN